MTSHHGAPSDHVPAPALEEVARGVSPTSSWMAAGGLNNAAIASGDRGTVVVDASSTERRSRAIKVAAERTSPAPISTLINTHHHLDHSELRGEPLGAPLDSGAMVGEMVGWKGGPLRCLA